MKFFMTVFTTVMLLASTSVFSEERYRHYKGEMPANAAAAQLQLKQYNAMVEALLAKPDASYTEMSKIHELTYTLENAVGVLTKDLQDVAEKLELLHKMSESSQIEKAKAAGSDYLNAVKTYQ